MPSASNKRPGEELDDVGAAFTPASKAPRTENDGSVDFGSGGAGGGGGRKKLSGSTRTGQACDRCKIRKIRCDARPGGCSPCAQNNTECKTTDRITGRATSRGHTEHLENENATLKIYMVELQQQLRDNDLEPKQAPSMPQAYISDSSASVPNWQQPGQWESNGYLQPSSATSERHGSQGHMLPEFNEGCTGDNYLGVSSENSWLTTAEGLSISLFGMQIDLGEMLPPENDPSYSAMSYQTFLKHAYNRAEPMTPPPLPAYEQAKVYSEWYFRSVQPFIPILHKPDFFALLDRVMKNGTQPTPAETVQIHMVMAVMSFQYAMRNGDEQGKHNSFLHYHYSLTFIPDLSMNHKLEDIQALALICSQQRSFPRPGAAWAFSRFVLNLAIEQGLHRTAKAWRGEAAEKNPHVIEMRKRVFWSIMVINVIISGKLGRPMPLRSEDFDIELPESVPDNLPHEAGLSKWRKCSFRAAIQGMRLLKIDLKVYSIIYALRTARGTYEVNVKMLEQEIKEWQDQLPAELAGGPQTKEEDRIFALYLDMSVQELQLLLHHPSLCRSASPQVMSNNIDICLEASNRLLVVASQLRTLKSLDTTWHYTTNFLGAIVTTLFAYTERQDLISQQELQKLRQDMDLWVEIMAEIGHLLGIGAKLQSAVRNIIDVALDNISRHLATKTASAAVANVVSPTEHAPQQHPAQAYGQNGYQQDYQAEQVHGQTNGQHYQMQAQPETQQQPPYPSGNQFSYPDPPNGTITGSYGHAALASYDSHPQFQHQHQEDIKPSIPDIEAQLAAHNSAMSQHQSQPPQLSHGQAPQKHHVTSPHPGSTGPHQQQHPFMTTFQSPSAVQQHQHSPSHSVFQPPTHPSQHQAPTHQSAPHQIQAGPAAWRHFTDNMMTNVSLMGELQSPHPHHQNPNHDPYSSAAQQQQAAVGVAMPQTLTPPHPMSTPLGVSPGGLPQGLGSMDMSAAVMTQGLQGAAIAAAGGAGGGGVGLGVELSQTWPMIQYSEGAILGGVHEMMNGGGGAGMG